MKYVGSLFFVLVYLNGSLLAQPSKYYGGSKQINDSIIIILEEMQTPTFMNRGNYFRGIQQYGKDSEQAKILLKKMETDDSLNLAVVEKLYRKYGWPKESQVGPVATGQAFLQIQHSGDLKTELRYLPVLRRAAKAGEFYKGNLALLEDRILTQKHKKQLYGTQTASRHLKNGEKLAHLWPIKSYPNTKKINQRRQKMGLEDLDFTKEKYDPKVSLKEFK